MDARAHQTGQHRYALGERPQDPRTQGHWCALPFRPVGAGLPASLSGRRAGAADAPRHRKPALRHGSGRSGYPSGKDHEEPGHCHACAEPAAAGGAESLPGGGHQQPGERRARGAELQRDVHQERDHAGFSGRRADLCLLGQRLRPRSAQPHAGSHGA